ncbi:efflux RND transporter periplasmic adaptor subunit [Paratissierella segnis]|uniref:Efflux RND transporter periplasmic adaptor subunit n=1 Tax=Paratissierella segnis TaxID=2763679 RepID=A0A926EVY0_9FIRM|nr:efflux RND transporter periplasmic adaptor subunit [Paratissierella segnis]MBC8587542.1 efflux RND transporter periplasmic adaptor subunit [Paratissierella segnis]
MSLKKSNKKKKIIIGVVCVLIVALIWGLKSRPKEEQYDEETAKTQDVTTYYSFSGNIESKDNQIVFSKNMLPIKKLYVKEGDSVKKGDVLFTLDDSNLAAGIDQAQASVEIAKINYEKMTGTAKDQQMAQVSNALSAAELNFNDAKSNLEKMTELYEADGISKQALDQVETVYESAELQLQSAQDNYNLTLRSIEENSRTAKEQLNQAEASYNSVKKQVDDLTVTAEVDGEVSEIFVEENESLAMGMQIMEIVDYDNLKITIKVDEYDIGALTVGKEVKVNINTLEKDATGIVSKISNQAQTINEVSFFTADIDLQKDDDLRVGLSVEVSVQNKYAPNATTISMKALQFDNENKPFVYIRDMDNKVVPKPVTVGINDGNTVEIIDGIKSGEVILVPRRRIITIDDMMQMN